MSLLRLITLLGIGLLIGFTSSSLASLVGLRLSYTGDDAITVTWNTASSTTSEVRYGTSPGVLTTTQTGTATQANGTLGFIHEVTLTGLLPNTTYYYVADSAEEGTSVEHSFTTRPVPHELCSSTNFIFLGDSEPDPVFGDSSWEQIIAEAGNHEPMFILHGGDMVYDSDDASEWTDFLTALEPIAAEIPFMPSIGNHDGGPGEGDGASYNQLFALPHSAGPYGSGTEDYYYFTAGNAIFVVLSTDTFTGGATPFATQAAWLDAVLTEIPRKWKFVIYHKPSYTYEALFPGSHPPNEEGQNAALVAIIDTHHVDMVFSGNNHWYERYEPSACATLGTPGSDQPCPVGGDYAAGTVYIVSGGAGAITIPSIYCGTQPGRAMCAGVHHYLRAIIDNETLTLETWAAFPEVNEIIDSITIVKSPDDCATAIDSTEQENAGRTILSCSPTPFTRGSGTTIHFRSGNRNRAHLAIYDLAGRRIRTLISGRVDRDVWHSVHWTGRDDQGMAVAAGVYLVRMVTGETITTKKLVLLQ